MVRSVIETSMLFVVVGFVVGTPASADDAGPSDGPVLQHDAMPGGTAPALDVLFVLDNSASMAPTQQSLADNFPRFMEALEGEGGGLPSLHVGVVSTDLGAGDYGIVNCDAPGDDGLLRSAPRDASCAELGDSFLKDVLVSGGGRETNFDGTLAEAFSCIAPLGVGGCGFEQPLESVRRALDGRHSTNDGFVRPEAFLVLVFVTDEDDCSVHDAGLFDPSQTDLSDPLGPLGDFRCAEFGVACGDPPAPLARAAGEYSACGPRAASPYVEHPEAYVEFLRDLKGDLDKVIVSVIAGPRESLVVDGHAISGLPEVQDSCVSANAAAIPAVRLGWFAAQFVNHIESSVCDSDLSDALRLTGLAVGRALEDQEQSDPQVPADQGGCGCSAAKGRAGTGDVVVLMGLALVACLRVRQQRKGGRERSCFRPRTAGRTGT